MIKPRLLIGTVLVGLIILVGACIPQPSSAPSAIPGRTPAPAPTPPALGLTLTILEPQDEAVVKESLLRVVGRTAPDAVVSINGRIIRAIDEDGSFTTVISLAEGPNLVEVIATDYQGNQVNKVLTVIYAPQG